jgi:hypothetical protein
MMLIANPRLLLKLRIHGALPALWQDNYANKLPLNSKRKTFCKCIRGQCGEF